MAIDFLAPQNFLNRELSWLEFNLRVLEEAEDPSQPLLERVKFLAIFASNLDEFFEVRVAGIQQQIDSGVNDLGSDDLPPPAVMEVIQKKTRELLTRQYALWRDKILPALATEHIRIHEAAALTDADRKWAHRFFQEELLPVLTPLAVDASHPFPQAVNKSLNFIVRARKPRTRDEPLFAIVQVPRAITSLVRLPNRTEEGVERADYIFLSALLKLYVAELFPGLKIEATHAYRVTRNSDLYIDEEEATNLLATIEQELIRARRGDAVRLEVEEDCSPEIQRLLQERYQLNEADVYRLPNPMSMTYLERLFAGDGPARLKDRPFTPVFHPALPRTANVFDVIRRQDVLLHHPYHSFQPVVDMVQCAAMDPHVLAIKMTLYRTSGDSPIVAALSEAAIAGKQVTAIVEVRARFDEAANIKWAQQLEDAGAHVVYGVVGLKTHCKALLIVRRDEDRLRQYVHLGTGNYNPKTARIYTDLSLLTSNKEMAQDVANVFNTLTGLVEYTSFKKLLVAPFDLLPRLKALIERERDHAKAGKPARIIAKINSLVDEEIIAALYEASAAGVQIDLIVRGICCLRPGVPKISENIRVISIVGRFLEHSRIYLFGQGATPDVYVGSADWMPRSFYRRVEIAFRIEDPKLIEELRENVLDVFLADRVKARLLQADGTYTRRPRPPGKNPPQAQLYFRARARAQADSSANSLSAILPRLMPQPQPAPPDVGRPSDLPPIPGKAPAAEKLQLEAKPSPAEKPVAPPKVSLSGKKRT